jgi:hypothetical protein
MLERKNVTFGNYIINIKSIVSSFIHITNLYLNLRHSHLEPYNFKFLSVMWR